MGTAAADPPCTLPHTLCIILLFLPAFLLPAGARGAEDADPQGHRGCFARRDPRRWLAKEALAQQSRAATGSSRDIPALIRKAGREPGVGQRSPSCGCSHSCHGLDHTSRRHSQVGHGKFTAAKARGWRGSSPGFSQSWLWNNRGLTERREES